MLTLPNFERLKIFHLVYQNKSIQKAADRAHVTRSAVSQSLKRLEDELGTKLFLRDAKNFKATPEGEALFRTIDPFVSDLNQALQKMDSGLKTATGLIRVGAPMDLGSNQLTKTMARFRQKYPDIRFELHLAVPIKQLEMLTDGKLDLAFIDNGDIHAGQFPVSIQPFLKEEFVLAASKALFKSAKLGSAKFEDLSSLPFIDYVPHAPVTRLWFKHHFGKEPKNLLPVFTAESVRAVLNAISLDMGAGVIPERLISGEFSDLKIIETSRGRFLNEIVIARQLGRKANFREKEFIQFCKSELRN